MKNANNRDLFRARSGFASLLGALIILLLVSASAQAAFTRPFVRQITGPSPTEPFRGPYGLEVDGEDNVGVSDFADPAAPPYQLQKFEAGSSTFLETLNITGLEPPEPAGLTLPQVLSSDHQSGTLYTTSDTTQHNYTSPTYVEEFTNTGTFIRRILPAASGHRSVAVDNSADPFQGSLYVDQAVPLEAGAEATIARVDPEGNPVNFTCGAGCSSYVSGNRITGTPEESFRYSGLNHVPKSLSVDSNGNVFVILDGNVPLIAEYSSSGQYLQSFSGEETPGLGEDTQEHGGFGGAPTALAVDPINGHVLVSIDGLRKETGGVLVSEGAIDEFDASGKYLNQITETVPGRQLQVPAEMAFDSTGRLYVVDGFGTKATPSENFSHENEGIGYHAVDVFDPGAYLPTLTVGRPIAVTGEGADLAGTVNPEGRQLSACAFQYVSEAAFVATGFADLSSGGEAPCVPAPNQIPADETAHSVQTDVTGLTAGVTYRYRLVATSSGELSGTASTGPLAFTAVHAPRIDSSRALNVSSSYAELRGSINPLGADTEYRFEYIDAAHYNPERSDPFSEARRVPLPAAEIGSGGATGSEVASVAQQVAGLKPSTTYHFRIVATNSAGETDGEREGASEVEHTFATLPAPVVGLADGRAYELVTPVDKGTTDDLFGLVPEEGEFTNFQDQGFASESGEQFFLQTTAAYGAFPASSENAYVFTRGSLGWRTTPLAAPGLGVQSLTAEEYVFDPSDLARVGINDASGSQANANGARIYNLLGPAGGPYSTLHIGAAIGPNSDISEASRFVGGSENLEKAVIETSGHTLCQIPGDAETKQDEGSRVLCEYTNGGEPTLVDVSNSGKLLNRCGAALGLAESGAGAGQVGGSMASRQTAVSTDGTRIVFTAPDPNAQNLGPGCWNGGTTNAPQIYVRSGGETVEISAPEASRAGESGHHPAVFVGASADDSRLFFLSAGDLTADSVGLHDPELYEYDFAKPEGERLSRISGGESGDAAGDVAFVPAVAADGSAVYFVARGRLTAGAPAPGLESDGKTEALDLYRYSAASESTEFITQVSQIDYPNLGAGPWWGSSDLAINRQIALFPANWYTTPNGRFLLFASKGQVTSYDSTAAQGTSCPRLKGNQSNEYNGHCSEVYRYDAGTHDLICVSCSPNGARPTSNALFDRSALSSASGSPRALSNDGSTAFFDTADPLVPQDNNGTLDVYEWHEGAISLISSGHDSKPSYYLGSSTNGANVFIGTHARLVPEDTDGQGDVYDARECSASSPCFQAPVNGSGVCEGDTCAPPVPAPNDATPGSLTYSGPGNPTPVKKSKPRRRGKKRHHRHLRKSKTNHRGAKR